MTRKKHVLALALALSVLVATVASSASARIDTPRQSKAATVTIWDFFVNSPKERAALMVVANQWAKKTGNKVVNPGDVADSLTKYPLAARGGRGPDVVQFPHDNLGRFAAAGRDRKLAGELCDRHVAVRAGGDAGDHLQGQDLGLPIARETTFLYYNKALIATAAEDVAELIAAAKKLTSGDQYGFLWAPPTSTTTTPSSEATAGSSSSHEDGLQRPRGSVSRRRARSRDSS